MAGGSEGDALRGDSWVWMEFVVGGDEAREIDQVGEERWVAGLVGCLGWIGAHAFVVPRSCDDLCHYMGCGLWEGMGGSELLRKWQRKVLVFSGRIA